MSARPILAPALAILALLPTLACSSGQTVVTGCRQDQDCGPLASHRCDVASGTCLCRTNEACAEGERCNTQGYCQQLVGCADSRDCPGGFFCDPTTNTCLANGRCATDLHCAWGEICDSTLATCRPGCRSHGDCTLGDACLCATADDGDESDCACDATDEAGRMACAVGRCANDRCISDDYCAFGERCLQDESGAELPPRCASDYDVTTRPYCDPCMSGVAGQSTCGRGPNFCLYSTYNQNQFCGADCSRGQACPNGFTCNDVIVVWMRTRCTDTSDCKKPENRSAIPCATSADCPNSALCDEEAGFCYGVCVPKEGANESFCACVEDDDCAQDACDPVTRECTTTRQPCDPALDDCPKIRCVDFGHKGGCLIGQNCAPGEGLTCEDMSNSTSKRSMAGSESESEGRGGSAAP
ncbi:MAG: hypothetical protein LBM75_04560 [Myxococcales bacterium]|jgi:hypothetical protein|nr:hypothetical protein [Myxococcales bacterium]